MQQRNLVHRMAQVALQAPAGLPFNTSNIVLSSLTTQGGRRTCLTLAGRHMARCCVG